MKAPLTSTVLRHGGTAAHVAGSQVALAASNYLLLAIAARHLEPAGFAAVTAYYLLINTVGRGLFAAVELETTRAVAAGAHGMRAALRHTGLLLVGALVLLGLAAPLVTGGVATVALLAVGAVTMAASYLVRGPLAGLRRYGRYAATFWVEAGVGLAGAVVLTVLDEHATAAWIAVLALAPGVAPVLLWARRRAAPLQEGAPAATESQEGAPAAARRRGPGAGWQVTASEEGAPAATGLEQGTPAAPGRAADGRTAAGRSAPGRAGGATPVGPVLWSAALLLASQGVWNLAPVLVTARLTDAATLAAGFTTVAVVVRAPVLLFPTIQAMLLPGSQAAAARRACSWPRSSGPGWSGWRWRRLPCRSSRPSSSPPPRHPPRGSSPCWRCRSRWAPWRRSRRSNSWPPAVPTPPRWPGSPGSSRCSASASPRPLRCPLRRSGSSPQQASCSAPS